ncbi:MAG: universal stress protein [Cyanobacteria bacterium P01_G01_bin.67]
MLKKILYADSGADNARDMFGNLINLPAMNSSEIYIMQVIPPKTIETLAERHNSLKQAEEKIEQLVKQLNIAQTEIFTIIREGDPKIQVLEVAKEINADLIIIGSRGLGRLRSILSNSVSQYVFQLAESSMLLIKDDIYTKRIKRVMVAIDKSTAAQYALDLAVFLFQGYPDAELYLTRINPDLDPDISLSKEDMENNPILAPAVNKIKKMGLSYRCVVTGGRPAEQIRILAEENNIDLLILGSPERRPSIAKNLPDLERLLGTSLSDYLRIKADCPVLLARKNK